jgi:L-fuculose-phosphate aldolase
MTRQLRARPGHDLDGLRGSVAQACRDLAASGLVIGTAGNVSARAGELVAVTPTGVRLASASADQIAVVGLDGRLVEGPLAPTSELPFHLAIYRRFGAGAVVHTHPPMGTAVSCVTDELPCIHYTLPSLGASVRVARYATFGTDDLAASIVEALEGGRRAALVASHGAVTYGKDLRTAVEATELLEWACGVYVHACSCGTPRVLGDDEQRALAQAFAQYDATRPRLT